MLITEELHLLLLRADGQLETAPAFRAHGEIAALLVDLAMSGAVDVTADGRVTVREDAGEPQHPVLKHGYRALREIGPQTIDELLRRPELDPLTALEESLIAAGILEERSRHILGFRQRRTPAVDGGPEAALRSRLAVALHGGAITPVADTILLVLLNSVADAPRILKKEVGDLSRAEFSIRVHDLGVGVDLADDVALAIRSVASAVITAVLVPTIIGGAL